MVYEFPELQGYMGGRYAELEGHPEEGRAMAQFYWPLSSNSELPETLTGELVSLAGKVDTLAGNFLIGQIPTGSEDPFALRRAAYGEPTAAFPATLLQGHPDAKIYANDVARHQAY